MSSVAPWRDVFLHVTSGSDTAWLDTAGIAGSLALGAIILGYYVTYSAGVRWRLRRRDKT